MAGGAAFLQSYYRLAKPGIVRGNLFSATAGFFLASRSEFNAALFIASMSGLAMVVASAAVFNNYIDRGIDSKMERTRSRGLASGQISPRGAIAFGVVLGIGGILILAIFANWLAAMTALAGFVLYVGLYSLWWKRNSVYGTEAGSLSGAIPPVVGYAAASNTVDRAAGIVFLILIFWQMPHFYSIALYRLNDYRKAKIPVLPAVKGIAITKKYILVYIILFTAAALSLTYFGYTTRFFAAVTLLASGIWLIYGVRNYKSAGSEQWGRNMFLISLFVLTAICTTIVVESIAA